MRHLALLLALLAATGLAASQDLPAGVRLGSPVGTAAQADAGVREALQVAQPAALQRGIMRAYRQSLDRTAEAQKDAAKPRGATEVRLYERAAPAVVIVMSYDAEGQRKGHGSGSVLSASGEILTNWHVIKDAAVVGIVFKPGAASTSADEPVILPGKVLKVDQRRDLALVQVLRPPTNLPTLSLGTLAEVKIGADVHAIGHPIGETWTYTKGVVSQIRRPGVWDISATQRHQAGAVIQTQTPINPGNSGGPLLNDEGSLIGVNTYTAGRAQGINFAVSVDDVRRFLEEAGTAHRPPQKGESKGAQKSGKAGAAQGAFPSRKQGCVPAVGQRTRNDAERAWITPVDLDCDGRAEAVLIEWDAELNRGRRLLVDTNGDGRPDIVFVDERNRGQWDYALHDVDHDGRPDVRSLYEGRRVEPVMVTRTR